MKHLTRRTLLKASIGATALVGLAAKAAQAMDRVGTFKGKGKYKVSGAATIRARQLLLGGFSSSRGPDVYVYLGNGSPKVRVAKLKSFSGAQSYNLPANSSNYSTVFIYCVKYDVVMGSARVS